MNFKTTVYLLALLVGLGSTILFYESKLPSDEEKEAKARQLLNFTPSEVTRIQIQIGKTITSCVRQKKGWQLVHPFSAPADENKVGEILEELAQAQFEREVDLKEPWKETRGEFTLWVNEKPTRLQFGENTPLGPNIYLKIEGRANCFVVNASLFSKAIVNADDLRDRRIFTWEVEKVSSFQVTSNKGKIQLDKKEGKWLAGLRTCDRAKVENYLYRLNGLRVLDFLGKGGVKKEEIRVEVEFSEGKKETLVVGEIKEKEISAVAEGGGQKELFTLSVQEKEPLKVKIEDFKEEKKEPS